MNTSLNAIELRTAFEDKVEQELTSWYDHIGIPDDDMTLLEMLAADGTIIDVDTDTFRRVERLQRAMRRLEAVDPTHVASSMSYAVSLRYVALKTFRECVRTLEQKYPANMLMAELASYTTMIVNAARRFIASHPRIVLTEDILDGVDVDVRFDALAFADCPVCPGDVVALQQRFYLSTTGVVVYGTVYRDGKVLGRARVPVLIEGVADYHSQIVTMAVVMSAAPMGLMPAVSLDTTSVSYDAKVQVYSGQGASDIVTDTIADIEQWALSMASTIDQMPDDDDEAAYIEPIAGDANVKSTIYLVDTDAFQEEDDTDVE